MELALCTAALLPELQPAPLFPVCHYCTDTPGLISLFNNGRQETKELTEVQEVQLCIKPILHI